LPRLHAFNFMGFGRSKLILAALIAASLFLHLFYISYPATPVNDEAHFATYAADYARGRPFFDIHPPLGKLIYATPLFLTKPPLENTAKFFDFVPGSNLNLETKWILVPSTYEGFPYLILRFISVFFGILLIIAVYSFLRILTGSESAALWGAFLIAFENTLLLETRFILMNGMYLAFGFFALALFFNKKVPAAAAGALWGLALGVKLTAVVFLGAIIAELLILDRADRRAEFSRFKKFLAAGFLVLFLVMFLPNNIFIPVKKRLALYEELFSWLPPVDKNAPPPHPWIRPLLPYLKASLIEINNTLSGYVFDSARYPFQSRWYQWPFMREPVRYFSQGSRKIYFVGNPAVWILSAFSVFSVIIFGFINFVKKRSAGFRSVEKNRPLVLLLGGYIFSLLPFIFIRRPTFLTHYLPAFTFGILLAATLLARYLDIQTPSKQRYLAGVFVLLIIAGFLISAPYTYGL
jgi:dolichyl-phosphate-mannose--protein O-mannosyl transferase